MMARAKDVAGLFFLLLVSSAAQEILEPPENTTVFLDQTAVFRCEVTGGHASWEVNGKSTTEQTSIARDDLKVEFDDSENGNPLAILIIIARDEYNETTVQCVVNGGFSDQSQIVSLRIQGLLSAVGNLTATSDGTSVTLSWTPPFSLDVTGVEHDIWYSVFIYNVTDENNPTAIPCTDCTNITETHYTFIFTLECVNVYNFSVIPLNGAGQGESSGNVTNEMQFPEVKVKAMTNDYRKVTFTIAQFKDVPTISVYNATDNFNGTNGTVFTLPADGEYNATVGYPIFCGGEKIKEFTTYDVQEPHAEPNENGREIMVTGKLIPNSSAEGCFLVVQCNFSTEITFFALNRNGGSRNLNRAIPMPRSNYTVYAHDLEKDGLPNKHPANLIPSIVEIIHGVEKSRNGDNPKNASISRNGLSVEIKCNPEAQRASCILVFRAYGNSTLYCVETFPATVPLDPNRNYTFALFKRLNNTTEERPFFTKFVQGKEDTRPQPSLPDDKRAAVTSSLGAVIAGVVVGVIVAIVGAGAGAAVIVFVVWRKHRKSYNTDGTKCPPEGIPHCDTHGSFRSTKNVEKNLDGEDKRGSEVSASSTSPLVNNEVAEKQQQEKANTYATVVVSTSGVRLPLTEDSRVEYVGLDIRATHKMARSPYAELGPLPTSRSKPPKMKTKTEGPYVGIQPHSATPVTHNGKNDKENVAKAAPKGPPTVESVMCLLMGVAGRWKLIAEGLGFDEDHIGDEIFTNNPTDEARLQDCVEQWISRLQPSWEKLSHVLRDMGEYKLAQKAWNGELVPKAWNEEPSQCSDDNSSEVVPGVEVTVFYDDKSEENRETKIAVSDYCASTEQQATSAFLCCVQVDDGEGSDNTEMDPEPYQMESQEEKVATRIIVSSTQVFAKETFTFKMTSFVGDSFTDENVNVFPEDEKINDGENEVEEVEIEADSLCINTGFSIKILAGESEFVTGIVVSGGLNYKGLFTNIISVYQPPSPKPQPMEDTPLQPQESSCPLEARRRVKKVATPRNLWPNSSGNTLDIKNWVQVEATFFLNTTERKFNLFSGNSHFGWDVARNFS